MTYKTMHFIARSYNYTAMPSTKTVIVITMPFHKKYNIKAMSPARTNQYAIAMSPAKTCNIIEMCPAKTCNLIAMSPAKTYNAIAM